MTRTIGYVWHLRKLMADRDMFATTELVPLLADRGVQLSREQVYRLVTGTPQRLNLAVLAALCDILDCQAGELIEPVIQAKRAKKPASTPAGQGRVRPRRARVLPLPTQ